jgi:hypothetical protein
MVMVAVRPVHMLVMMIVIMVTIRAMHVLMLMLMMMVMTVITAGAVDMPVMAVRRIQERKTPAASP